MPSECLALYEPSGKPLRHYGQKDVNFFAEDGQKVTIKFDVANVVRPIVSVGKLQKGARKSFWRRRATSRNVEDGVVYDGLGCSRSRHSFSSGSKSQRGVTLGPALEG